MNPMTSLYYIAPGTSWDSTKTDESDPPVCLVINAVIILPFTEGFSEPIALAQELGPPIREPHELDGIVLMGAVLLNAACTFALNLSSTWLIGKASGLVLTLAGVIKDVLLVSGSVVILGSPITSLQIVGCAFTRSQCR